MAIRITGPGVGLPAPQNLYPTDLNNAPLDLGNAFIGIPPGESVIIPAGDWLVQPGAYSLLQWLDPITGTWRSFAMDRGQPTPIYSPGGNVLRMANLTGCPVAAVVSGGGTLYTQATASITANLGGSLWTAVVGGSLTVASIVNPGAGFTIRPLVLIPDPPTAASNGVGGVPAIATCTLANATVTAVSLSSVGAGYTAATVSALLVPSPLDPNLGSITNGTVNFILTNTGLITAALCTNNGTPLATLSALTLTASGGAGSGATISPVILQSVLSAGVVAGGVAWGDATHPALITSVNGLPASVSAIGNPSVELTGARPRQLVISGTCNAGGTITAVSINDGGLFVGTPTLAVIAGNGLIASSAASVTVVMGGVSDTVYVQPM